MAPGNVPTGTAQGPKFTGPSSDAGVKAFQDPDTSSFKQLVAAKAATLPRPRPDPFALTGYEKSFDYSQQAERVFGEIGGFPTYVQPTEPVAPQVVVEPQPYRRLSGVVVGDSVLAIIEMGEGKQPELIRPGMKVPHSEEWTVVSIDQDKAVLRRNGNVLPKEIEVRLETAPADMGPAAAPNTPTGVPGNFPNRPPGRPGLNRGGGAPGLPGGAG